MTTQDLTVAPVVVTQAAGPTNGIYETPDLFAHGQRIALQLCDSTMVPERYRGQENAGNALIAVDIAWRLKMNPLMVMQQLYVVYGTPAWSGQMVLALVNGSGMFKDALAFEFKGKPGEDEWGCRCYAVRKSTGQRIDGPWVTIAIAKAEGWFDRKDQKGNFCSKWRTIPDLMMRYRAASYFGKTVCPEVLFGMNTREEVEDSNTSVITEVLEMPALGSPPTDQPKQVSIAPTRVKRVKEQATQPPTTVPVVPTKPAEPAKVTPTPEPEPAKTAAPTPPATELKLETPPAATPPKTGLPAAPVLIAEQLASSGISVDDFCQWLEDTSFGDQFKVDMTKVETLEDLPPDLIFAIINDPKVWGSLVKLYAPKK